MLADDAESRVCATIFDGLAGADGFGYERVMKQNLAWLGCLGKIKEPLNR